MAAAARVAAQAKINLGLRVLSREPDGYHQIETVFARLKLADLVDVRITSGARTLDVRGADTGPVEQNLAMRAAVAFARAVGWPAGFAITLEKRIPIGAGLGGGSADAGAVLRALNALAPSPMSEADLLHVATPLGADVPFLTSSAVLALGRGRGEQLTPLPALPERAVALVQPGFSVSTREAYGWIDAARGDARVPSRSVAADSLASWESLAALTDNDFERVVAARHAAIPRIVDALTGAGASIARMTGSGSTVYGIFAIPPDANRLAERVPGSVIVTSTAREVAPVERIHA